MSAIRTSRRETRHHLRASPRLSGGPFREAPQRHSTQEVQRWVLTTCSSSRSVTAHRSARQRVRRADAEGHGRDRRRPGRDRRSRSAEDRPASRPGRAARSEGDAEQLISVSPEHQRELNPMRQGLSSHTGVCCAGAYRGAERQTLSCRTFTISEEVSNGESGPSRSSVFTMSG
jgi:hypothetical protein